MVSIHRFGSQTYRTFSKTYEIRLWVVGTRDSGVTRLATSLRPVCLLFIAPIKMASCECVCGCLWNYEKYSGESRYSLVFVCLLLLHVCNGWINDFWKQAFRWPRWIYNDVDVECSRRRQECLSLFLCCILICVFYNEVSTTEWKSLLKFSPWSLLSICLYYDSSYYDSLYWVGNRHIDGLPKTWRDRRDSENSQSACPVCVWQTGQTVPSVCDRRDSQTAAETFSLDLVYNTHWRWLP